MRKSTRPDPTENLTSGPETGTSTPYRSRVATGLITLLIFVTAVCTFVPLDPDLPEIGLDASWRFAINEAVAQGLVFGSQIVFTLGPYASIYTTEYHPGIAALTLAASAWLALAWAAALRAVTRSRARWVPIAFCLMTAFASNSKDVLFLSYPMLLTLVVFRSLADESPADRRRRYALLAFACGTLGLLALAKATFLLVCAGSTALNVGCALQRRKPGLALTCIGAPLVAGTAFWVAAGQPVVALPGYLTSTIAAVSGYTEAMAVTGDWREIVAFLVASVVILAAILAGSSAPFPLRAYLAASFAFLLFLAFKGGFVRHDAGHSLIVARPLLLAGLCLPLLVHAWPMYVAAFVGTCFWFGAEYHHDPDFPADIPLGIASPYRHAGTGLALRWRDPHWPESAYDDAVAGIRAAYPFPRLDGTTDVYSVSQSNLLAAGNAWSPRPVFQSYAAYDAPLLVRNARHLESQRAATYVVFTVEPLDERYPALEDGASWWMLLNRYRATDLQGNLLVLEKNTTPAPVVAAATRSTHHAIGEEVALARANDLVFARFEIRTTWLGRLRELLFKIPLPTLEIRLSDGSTRSYRLLPRMARSEFMLSPLVEDTDDFARLFGVFDDLPAKNVVAFTVRLPTAGASVWRADYEVAFVERAVPPGVAPGSAGPPRHHVVVPIQDDAVAALLEPGHCAGSIEGSTAKRSGPGAYAARLLGIRGWLAPPLNGGTSDTVYLVLTAPDGRRVFAPLNQAMRADRAAHFRNPALAHSGFFGTIDLAGLAGAYTMGLASHAGDRWTLCSRFDRPLRIETAAESPRR